MKYKYLLMLILTVGLGFQYLRLEKLEKYFIISQKYTMELPEPENGNLIIENPQKYLIWHENRSQDQKKILENLLAVFEFSKVNYDLQKINTTKTLDISKYNGIILIGEDFTGMKKENFKNIISSVEQGNTLYIMQRAYENPFNFMAGIKKIINYQEVYGLNFQKKIFPGFLEAKPSEDLMRSSSLIAELNPDTEIIAASNEGVPLFWKKKYGEGTVMYANTSLFQSKPARGLMKQLISYGKKDVSIYPILNSKVVHLDDYPYPIPKIKNEMILKEYGMETGKFYDVIWWKDMMAIAERQKLKYTGFAIMNYNGRTDVKNFNPLDKRTFNELSKYGRNMLRDGAEIALHGYNHQPLSLEKGIEYEEYEYVPWKNIEEMKKGLELLKNTLVELYGPELKYYSYVAPSNLLTKTGKQALIETFPYLQSFSGIFYGEEELGLLIQEVGKDPDFPDYYSFPRFSSGLLKSNDMMWQIYNAIAAYGFVLHFTHPDDVIDLERGQGQTWDQLKKSFEEIFEDINKHFPHLQPQVQSQLNYEYSKIKDLEFEYEMKENEIKINFKNFRRSLDAQVRIKEKTIKSISGGTYTLIDKTEEYSLYLVKFHKGDAVIKVGDS